MARASFDVECLERIELALGSFEDARADPGLVQSLRDVVPRKLLAPVTRMVSIAELSSTLLGASSGSPQAAASWIITPRAAAANGPQLSRGGEMRCSDHAPVDRTEH